MTITISNTLLYYIVFSVVIMIPYGFYLLYKIKRDLKKARLKHPILEIVWNNIKDLDSFKKLIRRIKPSFYTLLFVFVTIMAPLALPMSIIWETESAIKRARKKTSGESEKTDDSSETDDKADVPRFDILCAGEPINPTLDDCDCKIGVNVKNCDSGTLGIHTIS